MSKRWAKLSCVFACTQIVAIACIMVDDGAETTNDTRSTDSGGSVGTGGSEASGSKARSRSSAGDPSMAGAAGAGGAGEPEAVGAVPAWPQPRPLQCGAWRARLYAETGRTLPGAGARADADGEPSR